MNSYLVTAGILTLLLGAAHSILGEVLIFRRFNLNAIKSDEVKQFLSIRQFRSLWASWHLVSVLGWGMGAALLCLAFADTRIDPMLIIARMLSLTFLVSSIFWLFSTKGKHPAWIVLLIISVLLFLV
ncbi:hypothetical protein [Bowmanella pacifica]|uniref:Uncharacterized protein n=1 Tax=Bowmanella pacifica TaxID=502051 RepID=A0A917YZY2_9ALTE|nr:hypothetical protein [Bowmanella pacifica]GGO70220.1 hypothetical protein GCM10010982_23200 [Bowmanella pacifica]